MLPQLYKKKRRYRGFAESQCPAARNVSHHSNSKTAENSNLQKAFALHPYYLRGVIQQGESLDNSYEIRCSCTKRKDPADSFKQDADVPKGATREKSEDPSIASILASLANYNREFNETPERCSLRDVGEDMAAESRGRAVYSGRMATLMTPSCRCSNRR